MLSLCRYVCVCMLWKLGSVSAAGYSGRSQRRMSALTCNEVPAPANIFTTRRASQAPHLPAVVAVVAAAVALMVMMMKWLFFFNPGEESGETRSKSKEHSVPAGNKRGGCQRPHSSELTHNAMHDTHIHTVIIYLPRTLLFFLFFSFLFSFFFKHPSSVSCICCSRSRFVFSHFLCALRPCSHILMVNPPPQTVQDECTVGGFRHARVRSPPTARPESGKCSHTINNLSSFCQNVISSCRGSYYERRMS